MHQAAEGAGTAVDQESAGRDEEEQALQVPARAFPACAGAGAGAGVGARACAGPGVLHLRKARLLQSAEDWDAAKRKRLSGSLASLNAKKEALLAGVVDGVPKGRQDSTLLASLLQSFSSRLQTVAVSQQIRQSLREQGCALSHEAFQVEKDLRCYGVASSHLKTLLKKSKAKDQKPDACLPDVAKNLIRDRFPESPHPMGQGAAKVVSEPLSCAARLQAVASMVEKRASPATSPKPSVACSQLALLLSSEAHLQQYSREHALKTQTATQAASERLAAMARLQENGQKEVGGFQLAKGMPGHLNGQARTPSGKLMAGKGAPFPTPMGILPSSPKSAGCRSSQDRSSIKQAANNSLLLHLLKSQTIPAPLNGHSHGERGSGFEDSGTPTTVDESSDNNPSFTDDSSGDESACSDCVPIDLSCKHRTEQPEPDPPVSLENLTQSLLNTWDPKVPGGVDIREDPDTSKSAKLNSHQKVTLLQLLLGHKSEDSLERSSPQEAQGDGRKFSGQTCARTSVIESPGGHRATPASTPPLLLASKAESPINLSQHSLVIRWSSPPYASATPSEKPPATTPSHLMDLTKSREAPGESPVQNEDAQNPATFSASKLLQNLAQCGLQASGGDARRPGAHLGLSAGVADRLSRPLLPGRAGALEESKACGSPAAGCQPRLSGSEIENLLERRTVLQLLLGNPNKGRGDPKEKAPLPAGSPQEPADGALGEQILMVKIKSEPGEDVHIPNPGAHLGPEAEGAPFSGAAAPPAQRGPAALPAPEAFKSEPASPQDFSFSKNGLLSRLLRQNQEGYPPDGLDSSPRSSELALLESRNLCVVPKKRKLYTEPLDNPFKRMKNHAVEAAHGHGAPEALYGSLVGQPELKSSRNDLEFKYPSGHGSSSDGEPRSWARESKSFNVLKQLLLSESCVRDLSQPRGGAAAEGKKKGYRHGSSSKPEFSMSSLNGLVYGPAQPGGGVDSRTFPYPGAVKPPVSPPFPEPLGCGASRPESGLLNGCSLPGDKGPIKWVIADVEKSQYEKDSPRLTKTNPILYYMLQKGSGSVPGREPQDKDVWRGPAAAESVPQVTVKEELLPAVDAKAAFFNLRSPYSGQAPRAPSTNGDAFGPLGNVLTIKKESE